MKNLKIIFFSVLCLHLTHLTAQPRHYFEHFSTEDGLPQFTITDIIQDHKGFMWFATWDGFSKFDGHTFHNFKVREGDLYQMGSNRIQHLSEDKYGYIWLLSYDDEAHCFNPYTETFKGLKSVYKDKKTPFNTSRIKIFPSGKVWLFSEKEGCVCVTDSLFTIQEYNLENERLKGDVVHDIFEDRKRNSWILTNNGLNFIEKDQFESVSYFFDNNRNNENQCFFSAVELGNEIWFGSNKGRIWKYSGRSEKFNLCQVPTDSDLTSFQQLSDTEMLITTSDDGFFVFNIQENNFRHYNTTTNKILADNKIRALLLDSHKQFWFETEGLGIYKFDVKTGTIKYYVFKVNDPAVTSIPPASEIIEDIYGRVWVHPRGGGFSYYDKETEQLIPFHNDELSADWRFSNILHSLFSDRQGNLWFCTRSHGLEKVTFDNNNFKTIRISPDWRTTVAFDNSNHKTLNISSNWRTTVANDVRAVLQDNDNQLWVATKDRVLNIYDEHYNHVGSLSEKGEIGHNHIFSGIIYSMLQDADGNIWLGTRTNGLFKIKKTGNSRHYEIEHFKKDPNDVYSISEDVIYSIFQDSKKNIWVGTYGGGLNLLEKTADGKFIFINHKNNLKNYPIQSGNKIRYVSENKWGNICVGTTTGLIMFSSGFSSTEEIQYKYYFRNPEDKGSLSNNDIHGICNTSHGEMFLVTFGGGLNKVLEYDKDGFPLKFKSYTMKEGLPGDIGLSVLEDQDGKLWISTENNLSRFDPELETFETFAEIRRLMSTNSFSEASTFRLKNNDLVFGFSGGILYFSPRKIRNSDFEPYVAFTAFRLNNQLITVGEKGSPLDKNIDDIGKLVLPHNRNSFSIEYTALDFVLANNVSYAYKLDGFDNDWIYAQKNRMANYTNIPKGEYVFRIKSTNSEGRWMENERTLSIKILPSFWETPLAILMYVLIALGIIYLVIRVLFTFYRLRKNVEMEKYLSEMKLRFFTDISHEIRTPLTMISAPVEYLLQDDEIPDKAKGHLNSISQNANRMLRLVNQILDFRKIQQSRLKVQEVNAGVSIENICLNFKEIARRNHIRFQFVNQAENEKIWVTPDFLEIVLMNLLSNAFKYTPEGKAITVLLMNTPKYLTIEVKDEGCGISKEKQKDLFVRFASFNEDKSKPSSGIGLSIVKDLVEKHSGKISVESEPGKGSVFTIQLMKGKKHFDKDVELMESNSLQNIQTDDDIEYHDENEENPDKKQTILIIEDNDELRVFIKAILEHDYLVIEAENGLEGLEKAQKVIPDFIVSDIMMPQMDGIELLQRLKNDINPSHIPVILLTAKTAIENKLEGLSYGADDYITKPFSVQYFRVRINNLLEQRKRIQEAFRLRLTSSGKAGFEMPPLSISSQDEEFINKVIKIVDEHMDDGEFTIDDLSGLIGMSRSVFSNKLKSLTGLTPFDFIRDLKLQRATQLLVSGEFMIKEVSYMIGISDTKYFGKIFKSKYGVTPQEYKNQYGKGQEKGG